MFNIVKKLLCDHNFKITNRHKVTIVRGNFMTSHAYSTRYQHDLVCTKCGKVIKDIRE